MNNKPLVSVIIPAYNAASTIDKSLTSLGKQNYRPLEVIVVNDGSMDRTVAAIKRFKQVKLINQPHAGAGAARNLGTLSAKGEILVLVDADMEFDANFVADLVKPILSGKAKGTWTGNEEVKNWENVWARCYNYQFGRYSPQMVSGFKGQRKVFRAILKSEFDRVKGFDSIGYTDDWTLVNKLGYQPKTTQALMYHYNPDSLIAVFRKAVWLGQRRYKLGLLGTIFTLVKHNAALSLMVAPGKALATGTPAFVPFKLAFDLGISLGALLSLTGRRYG